MATKKAKAKTKAKSKAKAPAKKRVVSGKMKGISRMDFERATGWMVRFYREGKTLSKFFADSLHGGKAKALKEAVAHRDAFEKKNPNPAPSDLPPPFRKSVEASASTGVKGVSETYHKVSSGKRLKCFCVSYTKDGQRKNKRFYFHLFPNRAAALKAATTFRQEMEQDMWKDYQKRLRVHRKTG